MAVPDDEYTYEEAPADVWVCNNCGAYAATKEQVVHHKTCKAGEAKFWLEFYRKEPVSHES